MTVDEIKRRVIDTDYYTLTNKISEAIFILADGSMIDGQFDMGIRGIDHRMIECVVDFDRYDDKFFDKVHDLLKIVRLVPETNVALVKVNQELSEIQLELIDRAGFVIEYY